MSPTIEQESEAGQVLSPRKRWMPPRVIVSELSEETQAGVVPAPETIAATALSAS
jgi:hypothetical protein